MADTPIARPRASRETLHVGIIGYGLAGAVFHAPLVASTPGMTVSDIVTANPARQAQARHDYPEAVIHATVEAMLTDPAGLDLIVVAAPNRAHVALGLAAMEAGLPVVVDKPVAPSSAEAERLLTTSQRTGQLFAVFQNRRWDNDFLTVRRLIAADVLGSVVRFESRFERYRPKVNSDAWRELPEPEEAGGLLFDLGAHLIDQARVLFGPPVSVYAESDLRRQGAVVDDDTFIALRFPGGQVAHLWASVVPRQPGPRMRVIGMRGIYEKQDLDPQEDDLVAGVRPGDPGWGEEQREHWGRLVGEIGGLPVDGAIETVPGSYETFYSMMRDAIIASGPLPVDPSDSIACLRIIEAAAESARTGAVIRLDGAGGA